MKRSAPKCGKPMRIIASVLEQPVIERILEPIGEPTKPPTVLPARPSPQAEFRFDQPVGRVHGHAGDGDIVDVPARGAAAGITVGAKAQRE